MPQDTPASPFVANVASCCTRMSPVAGSASNRVRMWPSITLSAWIHSPPHSRYVCVVMCRTTFTCSPRKSLWFKRCKALKPASWPAARTSASPDKRLLRPTTTPLLIVSAQLVVYSLAACAAGKPTAPNRNAAQPRLRVMVFRSVMLLCYARRGGKSTLNRGDALPGAANIGVTKQMLMSSLHPLNLRPTVFNALCATLIFAAGLCRAQSNLVLRADGTILEADRKSGAILRIHDASSGITLAPLPSLAENFRLTLQKPDGTTATVLGKDQALSESRVDNGTMTLEWKGPLQDAAGAGHDVAVRMTITATTGGLTFGLHVTNRSQVKVREVSYPMIGGLTGFASAGGKSDATLWIPTSTPTERPILPTAGGASFGYPGQMNMAFACIQSKSAGKTIYFASHDAVARYKTFRFVEIGAAGVTDMAACIQHSPFLR